MPKPWEISKKPWQTVSNKLSDTPPSAPDDLEKWKSVGYGAAEGSTLGFAPQIVGGAAAAYNAATGGNNSMDVYRNERDAFKQAAEQSREQNPGSYLAGNLVGSVATTKIPGFSALNPAMGESLLARLGKSGITGGLIGAAESPADFTKPSIETATQGAKDIGKGALLGSALQYGMSEAPKQGAKKVLNTMLGSSEEAVGRYWNNPKAVMSAPPVKDVTENVLENVGKFKQDVIQGSQGSRDILAKEGQKFSGQELGQQFQNKIDAILARSEGAILPQDEAMIKYLENLRDRFSGIPSMSANRVKDAIQSLDQATQWEVAPGQFVKLDDAARKEVRAGLDNLLKTASPAYAEKMTSVAEDTKLLNRLADRFKDPEQTDRLLNRIRTGKAPYAREELKLLDQRYGTNFDEDLQNALARESFDKGALSPGGSRNVNLYGNLGKSFGEATHIPGAGPAGYLAGAVVDKAGPKLGKGILDVGLGIKNVYNKLPGSSMLSNTPWSVPMTQQMIQNP